MLKSKRPYHNLDHFFLQPIRTGHRHIVERGSYQPVSLGVKSKKGKTTAHTGGELFDYSIHAGIRKTNHFQLISVYILILLYYSLTQSTKYHKNPQTQLSKLPKQLL